MKSLSRLALTALGIGWVLAQSSLSSGGVNIFPLVGDSPLDVKNLHGNWQIKSLMFIQEGKAVDAGVGIERTLVISADKKIRIDLRGVKHLEWVGEFDVKKSPVWVDLSLKFAPLDEVPKKTHKGLLKLEGDSLTIHIGYEERPEDFEQRKGSASLLIKCIRAKRK